MNDMKASNLSFRYKNGDKLILKDISVDLFVCLDSLDVERVHF